MNKINLSLLNRHRDFLDEFLIKEFEKDPQSKTYKHFRKIEKLLDLIHDDLIKDNKFECIQK